MPLLFLTCCWPPRPGRIPLPPLLATAADYGRAALASVTVLTLFYVLTWFLMCLVLGRAPALRQLAVPPLVRRIAAAACLSLTSAGTSNAKYDLFGAGRCCSD
ncbi:MAG: hypothetical protein QM767_05035 [Anaeromyxobacter sp.]